MKSLIRLRRMLRHRAEIILSVLLFSIFATFLAQVLFRVLKLPVGWTVEYVAIAWLWANLFGFAFVVKDAEIIRLDIVYGLVPASVQRVMDFIANVICMAIFIYTAPAVVNYVTFMGIEKTAYLKVPFSWVFSIYLAFMASVILRCAIGAWQALHGKHPKYGIGRAAETHEYD